MADIKQAAAMLRIAHRDLAALRGMADVAVFADEIFGFHAQQAIEKSLKAWMCALGLSYPFAHQARYEEGHIETDAPLERQTICTQISQLLSRVEAIVTALQ
jgi:HEPN domain-containing protein